ncbi:hypothetical protein BDB01DRAFT_839156 [Pilobolus umbonatus]|nr:hypothetical protein BDB01DRAFT_839156 [Pilobolus umbonatus]
MKVSLSKLPLLKFSELSVILKETLSSYGIMGHTRDNCTARPVDRRTYYNCGALGHIAAKCPRASLGGAEETKRFRKTPPVSVVDSRAMATPTSPSKQILRSKYATQNSEAKKETPVTEQVAIPVVSNTITATEEPTLIKNLLNKAPEEKIGSESQQDALSDISLIQERYIDVSSDDDMETESDVAETTLPITPDTLNQVSPTSIDSQKVKSVSEENMLPPRKSNRSTAGIPPKKFADANYSS